MSSEDPSQRIQSLWDSNYYTRKDLVPRMAKNKFGLPAHVDPKKLVPDATRPDHYVYPAPNGNPAQDEVYSMGVDFSDSRSEEDEENALKEFGKSRTAAGNAEADAIIEEAEARAEAIIAAAKNEARAIAARGTDRPGPRDTAAGGARAVARTPEAEKDALRESGRRRKAGLAPTHEIDELDEDEPEVKEAHKEEAASNVLNPSVVAAAGGNLLPGRDNPAVRKSTE